MVLKVTKSGEAKALSYPVKRWSRMGSGLTVTIAPPYADDLARGETYLAELEGDGATVYAEETVYQDFIFQGYVDDKGATVVTVSDLVFNRPPTK